ncbi:MAG: DNA-binding protein [Candidatus Sericytochromatia bacterium]|nr:DNA-binding protein [Candidatus Sericytochromatia bacterium]
MSANKDISDRVLTRAEARQRLVSQGLTIRQWARSNGLHERTVYELLRGAQKGLYGEAHRAAVLLGMKKEWCSNDHQ